MSMDTGTITAVNVEALSEDDMHSIMKLFADRIVGYSKLSATIQGLHERLDFYGDETNNLRHDLDAARGEIDGLKKEIEEAGWKLGEATHKYEELVEKFNFVKSERDEYAASNRELRKALEETQVEAIAANSIAEHRRQEWEETARALNAEVERTREVSRERGEKIGELTDTVARLKRELDDTNSMLNHISDANAEQAGRISELEEQLATEHECANRWHSDYFRVCDMLNEAEDKLSRFEQVARELFPSATAEVPQPATEPEKVVEAIHEETEQEALDTPIDW